MGFLMILNTEVRLKKGLVTGTLIKLQNAPLIIIHNPNGYLMCGYLDMNIANKMGDVAAKVRGVDNIDATLDAKIVELSDNAKKLGLKTGISGRNFLNSII